MTFSKSKFNKVTSRTLWRLNSTFAYIKWNLTFHFRLYLKMNFKFDDYFKRCYDRKVIGHDRAFVSFLLVKLED